jgi:hypothetical protein
MSNERGEVVELAIFKTKEGVTREELLAASGPVSEWAARQPGFISRDLTYSADGDTWIDVVWWDSAEAAHGAAQLAMTSESCAPMFGLIDMDATRMIHGTRVMPSVVAGRDAVGA